MTLKPNMSAQNAAIAGVASQTKPLYRIPTMKEIESVPHNGFHAISTFSGCGGSCLGYRLAGFKVLWASEFIPLAAETYRVNHPGTHVDERDIRTVTPGEILETVGMKRGELDLLDGSPPCASFSTAGKQSADWGKVKKYGSTYQRTDDLFFEYVRILDGLQPKVFLAENVSGLVKGIAKGYFLIILQALKDCGYNVTAKLLDAQWLGVPQARQRLIFIGTRNDQDLQPVFPKPFPYRYSFREAVGDLPDSERQPLTPRMKLWWELTPRGKSFDVGTMKAESRYTSFTKRRVHWDKPIPTICANADAGLKDLYHPDIPFTLSIPELKRCASFPDDFILLGDFSDQWERIGRAVPPQMMKAIAEGLCTLLSEVS